MKKLEISRKTAEGSASYKARGLDTVAEREQALQQDCVVAIKSGLEGCKDKAQAQAIANLVLSATASIHSDLERVLRQHGKKEGVQ